MDAGLDKNTASRFEAREKVDYGYVINMQLGKIADVRSKLGMMPSLEGPRYLEKTDTYYLARVTEYYHHVRTLWAILLPELRGGSARYLDAVVRLDSIESELKELDSQRKKIDAEVESLENEAEELDEKLRIEEQRSQNMPLGYRRRYGYSGLMIVDRKSELERRRNSISETLPKLEEKRRALTKRLEECKRRRNELLKRRSQLEAEMKSIEEELGTTNRLKLIDTALEEMLRRLNEAGLLIRGREVRLGV